MFDPLRSIDLSKSTQPGQKRGIYLNINTPRHSNALSILGPSLEGVEPSITRVCTLKTIVF